MHFNSLLIFPYSGIKTTDLDTIHTHTNKQGISHMPPSSSQKGINSTWKLHGVVPTLWLTIHCTYNCYYVTAVPGSPTLMIVPPPTCDSISGNQVTLQWTPPTDTGGPGVDITHYVVDVTGPAGVTCSPEPCNMTNGTNTTITGLLCNTNYTVTVRAVNCRGEGTSSPPVVIRSTGQLKLF